MVGVVGGDVVMLKQAGTFNSANVGSAIAVLVSDTISGASSGNYSLVQPTGLTAAITPKALTIAGTTVASKTYDGLATATITTAGTLVGVVNSDAVSLVNANTPEERIQLQKKSKRP